MVKPILDKTGISQRALAAFIDCDHTTLSRIDASGRMLKTDALSQLLKIYLLIVPITPSAPAKPSDTEKAAIQKAADWCRIQCVPLQKKLAKTLLQYEQAGNALQLLAAMGPAPADAAPKKQRWLDTQQYEATLKLEKFGWQAQHQLNMEIALLQAEADLLESSIK